MMVGFSNYPSVPSFMKMNSIVRHGTTSVRRARMDYDRTTENQDKMASLSQPEV